MLHVIEALKTEIINLVTDKLAKSNVKAAFEDKSLCRKLFWSWLKIGQETKTRY